MKDGGLEWRFGPDLVGQRKRMRDSRALLPPYLGQLEQRVHVGDFGIDAERRPEERRPGFLSVKGHIPLELWVLQGGSKIIQS